MEQPSRPAARIAELDALRGLAALGVVLFHLSLLDPAAGPGFAFGASGVDLFFIISGFVILMTLERTRDWREFVISRFSRLYPAYWACVTLAALAAVPRMGAVKLAGTYAANLTMFQLYLGAPDLDGSYWTLSIEMLFYLLMLGVYLAGRLDSLEWLGAACLALLFGYDSAICKGHLPGLYAFLGQWVPIVHHLPLFLAGIAFYRIKTRGASVWRYALLIACFVCQRRLYWDGGVIRFYLGPQAYQAAIAAYFVLFLLQVRGWLGFLANPATLWLGRISFCLYLCHQSLARDWLVPHFRSDWGWGFWPASALALAFVLALADALSRYVERPALLWIRARYARGAGVGYRPTA
jgi:peptidoglycan/LPS O-acetylase OafA/YrhL